ncbi:hypothetical protein PI126_g5564 [Phytophthora idaei]|nr:hypothetical protein PI126_g5564 [Phytophthora idaei]
MEDDGERTTSVCDPNEGIDIPNPTPWSPEEDLGEDDATSRKTGALQSRWAGLIRPDVTLYASCVAVVRAEDHSGRTDKDYADEAANRFTAKRELLNANAFHDYEEGLKGALALCEIYHDHGNDHVYKADYKRTSWKLKKIIATLQT